MISKIRMVHQCEFCKKKYFVKPAAEHHEKFCTMNPINFKACSDCKFCREDKVDIEIFMNTRTVKGFFCDKLKVGIYPTKVERLRLR